MRYPRGVKRFVIVLLLFGCQSSGDKPPPPAPLSPSQVTADDCQRFLTKARATIQAMGAHAGMTYTEQMEATAAKDCRADIAAGRPMALGRCVLDAPNEGAVHKCFPTYDQLMTKQAP